MNTDPVVDIRARDGEWTVTGRHLGEFILVVEAGPFPSGAVKVTVQPPPEHPSLSLDTPSATA